MTPEDLRAAVAAGIVTEAQAARLTALADDRAGRRSAMPREDEPFEFFRGFSEIFVSIGLVILLTGVAALLGWLGGPVVAIGVPALCSAVAWWWATYFTLKRRMNLPSMVLASAFGCGVFLTLIAIAARLGFADERGGAILAFSGAALAMAVWYRRFRLPFSAFILGVNVLGAIYALTASTESLASASLNGLWDTLFNLRESPVFASATLVFGIGAFLAGMWFDTRDPHRLGRHAATAFWLHLLAAPALVNTVAMTLLNSDGAGGRFLLFGALLAITLLALVIDRRSFLSAAIAYIAIVIGWVAGDSGSFGTWVMILLMLGALITAIGTWWVQLRAFVMKVLPNFPGKSRLPPYSMPE